MLWVSKFFFFKLNTAYELRISAWSSDVCSSDLWKAASKVVYSTTLTDVFTERTRLEASFVPEQVREIKESATSDLAIAGAELSGHAFQAGLVDEYHLLVPPVVIGGGKPAVPRGVRAELSLLENQAVGNGVVYLRYAVKS